MFDILSSLSSFYFFSSWFFLYFTSSALYDFVSIASHQHMFDILFSLPFLLCFSSMCLTSSSPSWNPSTQFSLTSCSSVVFLWSFLCTSHYPAFHFTSLSSFNNISSFLGSCWIGVMMMTGHYQWPRPICWWSSSWGWWSQRWLCWSWLLWWWSWSWGWRWSWKWRCSPD